MLVLVVTSVADDLDQRVRAVVGQAEVVHARPDDRQYKDALARAEIIIGRPPVEDLSNARALRWLQLASAGANRYVGRIPQEVILTNASGVFGVPVAEHVFALMLGLSRALPGYVRSQAERDWNPSGAVKELSGSTCGVLGVGDIGMAVADRARAFGMRVLAFRRNASEALDGIDAVYGEDDLAEMLSNCDFVVNTLPETSSTRGILDRDRLRATRKGAILVNVGRGTTMDEAALIEALQDGHLAGAGLDVFVQEPLPQESPLWDLPNVIITPHVGGASPREAERFAELIVDNLERYRDGRPMRNRVDPQLGY